jgi:hypothetical protein
LTTGDDGDDGIVSRVCARSIACVIRSSNTLFASFQAKWDDDRDAAAALYTTPYVDVRVTPVDNQVAFVVVDRWASSSSSSLEQQQQASLLSSSTTTTNPSTSRRSIVGYTLGTRDSAQFMRSCRAHYYPSVVARTFNHACLRSLLVQKFILKCMHSAAKYAADDTRRVERIERL